MDRRVILEINFFFLILRIGKGISYFIFILEQRFRGCVCYISKVMVWGSEWMGSLVKSYYK